MLVAVTARRSVITHHSVKKPRGDGSSANRSARVRANAVATSSAKRIRPRFLIAAAGLVAILVTAYRPALDGHFIWDDDDYVSANATLRSAAGLKSIWLEPTATPQYYPLVHTSYWLEYRLWGLTPTGYHVTNLALHAAATFVLWRVLLLLAVPGAALIAAIFAVHPVHVESVAWITERKNVLSAVFYLSSMLAYLHFALDAREGDRRHRRRWQYAAACALFVCALLSKTVTATLPAALVLLVVWKRGRVIGRDVWPLVPLFAVGVSMGLVTVWLERHHVGAQGMDWQLSALQRIVIAGRALWFYLGKLVWPTNLTFIYPRWHVDPADPRQLAFPVAALIAVVVLWVMRRKIGSGALVAALLFAGTLFPALGFFDTFPMRYSFVADHFQYLASIPAIALIVAGGGWLLEKRGASVRRLVGPAAALLILALAALTWRQCHIYADQETLWRDTIRKDPDSWMGHTSLGAVLGQRGAEADAEIHYRDAVRLNPDFAMARINLGGLLANKGRFAEAIPHYREAVRLEPNLVERYISLGRALQYNGQADEAVAWLRQAAERWPDDASARAFLSDALANRGAAAAARGAPGDAETDLREAVRLNPESAIAHFRFAVLLANEKRYADAITQFRDAVRLQPDSLDTYVSLGRALQYNGQPDEAVTWLRAAVDRWPDAPIAREYLGDALVAQRQHTRR